MLYANIDLKELFTCVLRTFLRKNISDILISIIIAIFSFARHIQSEIPSEITFPELQIKQYLFENLISALSN